MMSKEFNITGLCIPEQHYMVDISDRVNEIVNMIEKGKYFTINRPRQYGKTTTLKLLARELRKKYFVITISLEGTGDTFFSSEEKFCGKIFNHFADSVEMIDENFSNIINKYQKQIVDFNTLSRGIKNLIRESGKDIVLLIDEVDKSSNSRTFLQFLGLLRNKYLARSSGEDITFKSVVLAGVHDIKNLKLAIRDESETRFNSPWNIAVKFNIDMSFTSKDIEKMLSEYRRDKKLDFNTEKIAKEIYRFTGGYPYLVSDICLTIDQDLAKNWTLSGVEDAVKQILEEQSTLADDVVKNIENNPDLENVVMKILFEGEQVSYNPYAYYKGIIYGIFSNRNGRLVISNRIFEKMLYGYLLEKMNIRNMGGPLLKFDQKRFIKDGKLDMEQVLLKFKECIKREYRKKDDKLYESQGRLLFLLYLSPIINGTGFYDVESETRENKRMDLTVSYNTERFILELKIWDGPQYEQEGLLQLADYLDIQGKDAGYMLTFGSGREQEPGWITVKDKRIFNVVV